MKSQQLYNSIILWLIVYFLHFIYFKNIDNLRVFREFPTFTRWGISIPEFYTWLLIVITIFMFIINKIYISRTIKYIPRYVIIAVIIFYLSVILSTYVGINRGQAVQTHLRFSFFLPLFIACGYYIVNDEKQITVLIKLILIGCTLLSISILWEIMFGEYEQYGFDFQYVTGFAMIYFLFKIILKGGGSVSDYIILLINTIPISISFTKPVIIPLVVAVLLISLMVIYNSSMKIKFRSVFVFIVFVIAIFSISISSNSPEIFINKIERRILKGGYITNSQVVLGQDIWSGRFCRI